MMFYKKLMLVAASAVLGASFAQQAGAWGTGGSIGAPLKTAFADLSLYCDLSDPRSTATITTTPSNLSAADAAARPSFLFQGNVVCAEVHAGVPNPTLANAITLQMSQVPAVGVFNLVQVTNPVLFPGLVYTGGFQQVQNGTRTWSFDVNGHTDAFPYAQALWRLVPVDSTAKAFCNPAELGVSDVPTILDPNNCQALFGLRTVLPLLARDYGGTLGLGQGQVFTFTTNTKNGVESAAGFKWAPCHTTRFIGPLSTNVDAGLNSADITANSYKVSGTPAQVTIPISSSYRGDYTIHVMVQPNDLWRSSGEFQWSNDNGLIADLYTTSYYDTNNTDQLDQDLCGIYNCDPTVGPLTVPTQIGTAETAEITGDKFMAPQGALVGAVGNKNKNTYTLLGPYYSDWATNNPNADEPDNTVSVAQGQMLKLFYWDLASDSTNTGSVAVTAATDEIECAYGSNGSILTQGKVRGDEPVEVSYKQTTLNVTNTSDTANFSVAIYGGCSSYSPPFTIGSDGSPIIVDPTDSTKTQVYFNNGFVNFSTSGPFYGVNSTGSSTDPSCTGSLLVNLKQLDVINAVAPNGVCTNGTHDYKVEVGSGTTGWFAGTSSVTLSNCSSGS